MTSLEIYNHLISRANKANKPKVIGFCKGKSVEFDYVGENAGITYYVYLTPHNMLYIMSVRKRDYKRLCYPYVEETLPYVGHIQ